LGSNFIGNEVAEDLCHTAIKGQILQYLDLSNNNIDHDVMVRIEESLVTFGTSFFPKFDEISTRNDYIR
jgi:hypothetical protein